jgi:pSer/pThr/pTyr-binding forkhead associated (FHA) protein/tetratricopeptide (TPR) repeat protein
LVAQAGPAEGQTFELEGDELAIGRASDNPVSIPDTSVSRKHALLRKTETGWALSDLGSGNGTLLNGEAVSDEIELSEGDVITMGDTELRFVSGEPAVAAGGNPADTAEDEDGDSAAPGRRPPVRGSRGGAIERAPGGRRPVRTARTAEDPEAQRLKKRKTFIRVGGVAVLVMALGVGWKAIDNKRREQEIAAQALQAQHRETMGEMFRDAKTLVKQGNWVDAKAKLLEIQAIDDTFESKQIGNYLAIADKEVPNQAALEEKNTEIKEGSLAKAAAALKRVKTTPQSDTLMRTARDALDAKVIEKIGEARGLQSQRDLAVQEKVKAIAEDILAAHEDDHDAAEIKKSAETTIYAIKNPTYVPPPPETPWVEVQSRFKTGDSSGALSLAQACANKNPKCRDLEAQIKEWDSKSKKVEDLSEGDLIGLFELDKKIAGGSSSEQSRPIRTQLVTKLFMKASQLKTTGNWSRATEYARKVLAADPNHAGAQALVNDARTQAKDVYLRGYQLKETNPDEAIRLFKDVLNMTPADDDYNQKAKTRLAELQKQ